MTNATVPVSSARAIPYSEYRMEVPFLDHLKVLVEPRESGGGIMIVKLEREHMNGQMQAHGGLIMTLLDMAMASAARNQDAQNRPSVTVEMKCNFMRPGGAIDGGLRASGRLCHGTRSLAFCDGELHDKNGQLIATASGTFKYINKPLDVDVKPLPKA
ncbi:PaaI family thioesterase [Pseudomonas sp. CG7]|uniref:PaaI family thioesterase n=1 Tax=Pseudomonas sp. CG7 TaxID=191007 RepID=UPI00203450FD|nr:PaaI family thioesterase [Pseudomonas sp. CG7]MCM2459339.1 PaaI family thioesterase [Pseudomonas sp. CG7]